MRIPPDSWYAMTPRGRCLCWSLSSALLLICATLWQGRIQEQPVATQQANARLWIAVRKLSPPDEARSAVAIRPFSPLEFDTDVLRMVRWQPRGRGGELVMEATWAQIPSLFVNLARRDVAVERFSIQPEQNRLQIVMQLEHQDAG